MKRIFLCLLIATLLGFSCHTASAARVIPLRLQIPSIGLDTSVITVGLDHGVPIVTANDVDWWQDSVVPGAGGNIVFWGHYRQLNGEAGPFYRLRQVQIGDEIVVITDVPHRYIVTYIHRYDNRTVEYMLPTTWERLTLITCAGRAVWTAFGWQYPYRLVVMATPKNED